MPPVGPICGNGIVESGEQCDDGNSDNTDSCLNNCTLPSVSACTSLCLSDPDGNVPFTFEYRCHGTGDEVLVELINAQDVVVMTSATASGIFTVMNPGVYEVVCSYDGETSDPCQQVVTV